MIKDNKTTAYKIHQLLLRNRQYFVEYYSPVPNRVGMDISRPIAKSSEVLTKRRE